MSGLGPRRGPTPPKPKDPRPKRPPQHPVGTEMMDSRGRRYVVAADGSIRRLP